MDETRCWLAHSTLSPAAQIYAATHLMHVELRRQEFANPIMVDGGGAIIAIRDIPKEYWVTSFLTR